MAKLAETSADIYLWQIVFDGLKDRYGNNVPPEAISRVYTEMDVITNNKFTDYILNIWDIHDFCRNPNRVFPFCKDAGIEAPPDGIIPLGPGRGSVGGSIVCYAIGIHECDPILFGLYFERFLNPERIAYPDIDFDISQKYRHIVLAYIAKTRGEKHVAQIITYSTLSAKTVISDTLKSANVQDSVIQAVKDTIPSDPEITIAELEKNDKFMKAMCDIPFPDARVQVGKNNVDRIYSNMRWQSHSDAETIRMNLQILEAIRSGSMAAGEIIIKSSWNFSMAIDIMKRLEGLKKNESTHSAGVVVAPVELESNVPLLRKDGSGVLACQYDMVSLEELGFLKMDALGLRTVDVNHDAERFVRKWYDPKFEIRKVPYNDKDAIDLIRTGDTVGIFQIESSGFTQMMIDINIGGNEVPRYVDKVDLTDKEIEIKEFMWISAGIALYRPGPLDAIVEGKTMVQHLIDRKAGKENTVYLFREEKEYLEETYGVLVYQEQVMARVRQMTGCTMGRSDIFRKAMGKKDPVLMKEQMDWFTKAATNNKFSEFIQDDNHKKILIDRAGEEIKTFARYGFNKAHTVEYGHICYRNAYLKAHYPVAYYAALLNSETADPKRQAIIIRDMLKHGVQLLPPLINASDAEFTMTDQQTIRFGLAAIKNIGENALKVIINERNANGLFKSVEDFRIRIPATICNVIAMESLAKCGAFDDIMDSGLKVMGNRATLVATIRNICNAIGKYSKKKPKAECAPSVKEVMAKYKSGAIVYDLEQAPEDKIAYAIWEKEILKYYISAHPIDAYIEEIERWTAVQDVELEDLPPEFYLAGFFEGCHETIIKKEGRNKGKAMGFVTIGTQYRTYEATLFPGIYESCLPYMNIGSPVVIKGKRDNYNGKVTIQGVYMRNMTNKGIRDCPECHIRLKSDISPLELFQLKSMIEEHPGMTVVFIHILNGYDDITIQLSKTIALNDRIIEYCKGIGSLSYKPN